MSNFTASISAAPITATVSESGVIVATVSGGIGPKGEDGAAGGSLDQLTNVRIVGAADGDLLQFKNDNLWHNDPIVNGGDF